MGKRQTAQKSVQNDLRIGTSGWTYDDWSGKFYPEDIKGPARLEFYATQFNAVEINATFYRLPTASMVTGWNRRMPPDFHVAVKGSRRITHLKRLQDCQAELREFIGRVAPLQQLRVILWQLPPSFRPDLPCLESFFALLRDEAAAIPHVLPELQSTNKDVRLAAVETLGKLRARQAAAPIRRLFYSAERADRMPYLTAEDEPLLAAALDDKGYPTPLRAQAALGLGRIASPTAVATLWRITRDRDRDLVEAAEAGLRLAEDRALQYGSGSPRVTAEVCAGFESPLSNRTLERLLQSTDGDVLDAAVAAARVRSALVGALLGVLNRTEPSREGHLVEAVVDSLYSTENGRSALAQSSSPIVRAFFERRKLVETFGST